MSLWRRSPGDAERPSAAAGAEPLPAGDAAPLRGIVLRDSSDTLVVKASPADVERFAARRGADVTVLHPEMVMRLGRITSPERRPPQSDHPAFTLLRPGDTLFDSFGRVVAVIEGIDIHVEQFDTTAFGDAVNSFMSGRREVIFRAIGIEQSSTPRVSSQTSYMTTGNGR